MNLDLNIDTNYQQVMDTCPIEVHSLGEDVFSAESSWRNFLTHNLKDGENGYDWETIMGTLKRMKKKEEDAEDEYLGLTDDVVVNTSSPRLRTTRESHSVKVSFPVDREDAIRILADALMLEDFSKMSKRKCWEQIRMHFELYGIGYGEISNNLLDSFEWTKATQLVDKHFPHLS